MPPEYEDTALMERYGWSWDELLATPAYIRRVCLDTMYAKARQRSRNA